MSHLDPEQLALIALGEPVASPDERRHLASCNICAAEVVEMTHAAVVARSAMGEAGLEEPPPRVWARIADELGLSPEVAPPPASAQAIAEPPDERVARASDAPEVPDAAPPAASPRTSRRWSAKALWALAASVALVLVVAAGTWVGMGMLSPTPIATAALEAFPAHPQAVGTAEIDEARDGARTLRVTLEGDVDSADYREVWLIRNDGGALISLGVLEGTSGSFAIPEGVDLSTYDLVDISFEPIDGDPAHSGDSIVRGQLSFA